MADEFIEDLIRDISDKLGVEISIIDKDSRVIVSSDENCLNTCDENARAGLVGKSETFKSGRYSYGSVAADRHGDKYLIRVEGADVNAENCAWIIGMFCEKIKEACNDKNNKKEFVKNILFGNVTPEDICINAKRLRIAPRANRTVYVLFAEGFSLGGVYDEMAKMFPTRGGDYIINDNKSEIILVKEWENDTAYDTIYNLGSSIVDKLKDTLGFTFRIGFGTVACDLKGLPQSYNEAKTALEINKMFYKDKQVASYEDLGVAQIIYQLPLSLCKKFIKETVKDGADLTCLDKETIVTVNTFFENNLNISKTARELFIHRNTLLYRLDKLNEKTGFDVKMFDRAATFKLALMIEYYIKQIEGKQHKPVK